MRIKRAWRRPGQKGRRGRDGTGPCLSKKETCGFGRGAREQKAVASCARSRARTYDLAVNSRSLYLLSYASKSHMELLDGLRHDGVGGNHKQIYTRHTNFIIKKVSNSVACAPTT